MVVVKVAVIVELTTMLTPSHPDAGSGAVSFSS